MATLEQEIPEEITPEEITPELEFDINGHLFPVREEFVSNTSFNYQHELKTFNGKPIPEQAKGIMDNFWRAVCTAYGNLNAVTSEKVSKKFRKELNNQEFVDHIIAGDCTINYTKHTKESDVVWSADGLLVLSLLIGIEYDSTEDDVERKAISW